MIVNLMQASHQIFGVYPTENPAKFLRVLSKRMIFGVYNIGIHFQGNQDDYYWRRKMAELTRWQIVDLLNRPGILWLVGIDLSGLNLSRADLTGADLEGANLTGTILARAILDGANLEGALMNKAVLGGASLVRANLLSAKMIRTDLSGAKLEGANLFRADLSDANLTGANLYNANLRQANLSTTNLTDANMRGAVLPDGKIGLSTQQQRRKTQPR